MNNIKTKTKKIRNLVGFQIADTNPQKRFEVTLVLTQEKVAVLNVSATSRDEAAKHASATTLHCVQQWDLFGQRVSVESVQPLKEGNSHE